MSRYRFRPRFRGLPWLALAVGVSMLTLSLAGLLGGGRQVGVLCGAFATALALLYWASPAWRLVVEVSDAGVRVVRGEEIRMQVTWAEVQALKLDAACTVAVLDGGSPERRLLVPGKGLPAPYRIENSAQLITELARRVPAERHAVLDTAPRVRG